MRRCLLAALLLLSAAPALAQGGSIALTAPITFTPAPAITQYDFGALELRDKPTPRIYVELVASSDPSRVEVFTYPQDCGSPGADAEGAPLPPRCPARDEPAEIRALLLTLNGLNLQTRSLWRRIMDNLCADFPHRFPTGCEVK